MGVSSAREKIESKMLKLKLRRVEIKQERMERVKQLEKLTGKEIIREPIPDYIDHSEDEINIEDIENENEEIEEEDIIKVKKGKKGKKKKEKKGKKKKKDDSDDEEEDEEDDSYDNKVKKSKKKKNKKHNHYEVTNQ